MSLPLLDHCSFLVSQYWEFECQWLTYRRIAGVEYRGVSQSLRRFVTITASVYQPKQICRIRKKAA